MQACHAPQNHFRAAAILDALHQKTAVDKDLARFCESGSIMPHAAGDASQDESRCIKRRVMDPGGNLHASLGWRCNLVTIWVYHVTGDAS